jgi:spermidine synthase
LLQAVRAEPAELLGAQATPAATARLGAYWQARNRFLAEGAALAGAPRGRALVDAASPGLLQVVRLSAEFEPAYQPLLSMARSLLDSDPPAARQLLQAIVAAAPERPEARELLGAAAQLRE